MTRKFDSRARAGACASSVGVALLLGAFGVGIAHAQAIMSTPTISVPSRIPTISPSVAGRVSPVVTGRVVTSVDRGPRTIATTRLSARLPTPVLPYVRYSPNLYPACTAPYRDADGECIGNATGGGSGKSGKKAAGNSRRNTT